MPWERELESLESAIVRVNTEYDAFLYGSAAKPPVETRKNVERIIRRLSGFEPESAADRYRFATLQGRFNALCERWDRLQAEKEAGKRPGVHGGFARESRRTSTASPGPAPAGPPPNAPGFSSVGTSSAADRDAELFDRYLAARRARGEDVHGYDLDRFKQSLAREREKLKERPGFVDVDFEVAEREGRVKLVARKRSPAEAPAGGEEKQ